MVCLLPAVLISILNIANGSPALPPDPDDLLDLPDPAQVYYKGTYYQYGGQNVISSSNLKEWTKPTVYWSGSPTWSSGYPPGAPSVYQMSDTQWNVYYNVPHKNCHDTNTICQCVGVSISHSGPKGPFKAVQNIDPIVCDTEYDWIVDPCVRKLANNQLVLYWKTTFASNTSRSGGSGLWIANMSADGLSLNGPQIKLLTANMNTWEIGTAEGPSTVYYKNKWRLFYSGNAWTSANYAIGYANCDTAYGPCNRKTVQSPWIGSYNDTQGPGGQEFWTDESGEIWMIMHGWQRGKVGYNKGGVRAPRTYPLNYLEQKFGTLE